jgi:carboxyl-terminal processing protease
MTSRTRFYVLIVSTPLVAFAIVGGLLGKAAGREDSYQFLRVFEDVRSLVLTNYVEDVDFDHVMEGAMRGLAEGLDPDSAYLTPEQVDLIEKGAPEPAGDTGIELTRQYYLRVIAARDGSPAARAGLRSGDYIRGIDGKSTRDMSVFEGMRLLRGPAGSKVNLTVLRGSAAEPHEVVLVREPLSAMQVTSRMLADGIGFLRVATFGAGTVAEVRRLVAELERAGATRLIVDLRGTAQGSVEAAVATSRLFVASGILTKRESRGTTLDSISAQAGDGAVELPITLLTTAGTSGPAEVFAAALAGNARATLVGERTLGRAAEQRLVRLPDGSGLWMTWARYLTPAGKTIQGAGLDPDEAVDEPDVEFGAPPPPTDPILDKAIDRASVKKAA